MAIWCVDLRDGDDNNSGKTSAEAFKSFQRVSKAIKDGDKVLVSDNGGIFWKMLLEKEVIELLENND